jgi:hypothetical protein
MKEIPEMITVKEADSEKECNPMMPVPSTQHAGLSLHGWTDEEIMHEKSTLERHLSRVDSRHELFSDLLDRYEPLAAEAERRGLRG